MTANRAEQFRALHIRGNPIVLFNVWDVGSARAVAAAGAKALATSSWSVANANGFSDGERMPRAFVIDHLRRIVGATDLPVTIDLESGYSDAPDGVGETIRLAVEAGVVGCNLEDSVPTNGRLRDTRDQIVRIQHARRAASLFINARTDVFLQRAPGRHDDALVADVLDRARAYADAGADGLFVPGVTDIALIARLAESSPLPLNVMVDDRTPPLSTLAAHGVARISHGPRPYLQVMKALGDAARAANV